jgi:5-hydroxyisourate hydrolase-like protein (transthyretin family)
MIGNRTRLLLCAALVVTGVAAMTVWAGVAAAAPASFSITGHVTDTAGSPIQDVHVCLYRYTVSGTVNHLWSSPVDDVYTDASGNYAITYPTGDWPNDGPNSPGYAGTYAVLFWPPGVGTNGEYYRPQWWNGAQGYWALATIWQWDWQAANIATDFAVPASGVTMPNVNAVLEPYQGTIDCTVLDASTGKPIPNVSVTLFHYDTVRVGDAPYQENQVSTDANGRFTYAADPTLAANSWWTLLFDQAGYSKVWLGGVSYQAGVGDPTQSAQAGVTHFQVASNATSTITMSLLVSTSLSKPTVSSAKPAHGTKLTFTDKLTPGAAALSGTSKLYLWHRETKVVNGKKVTSWRLRSTLKMKGSASGKLTASAKLAYAGKWEMQVAYSATKGYAVSTSAMKTFTVK